MANVIIIEDDSKITYQYNQLFKELNPDHKIKIHKTGDEFHNIYFKTGGEEATEISHPLLKSFGRRQLDWIVDNNSSLDSPAPTQVIKIELNKEKVILSIDSDTTKTDSLFGFTINEILSEPKQITTFINENFHILWNQFLDILKLDKVLSTAMAFVGNNNMSWLVKVSGKKLSNGHFILVIRPQKESIEPVIANEKRLKELRTAQPEEHQKFNVVDMIIFKSTNIKGDPGQWVEKTLQLLKDKKMTPDEFRTRFVMTKYEDDQKDKQLISHPFIDDLIYYPLDRLVFLQKIEIIFGLPDKTSPSYLFLQEEKFQVELSKMGQIEFLSEVGCAIRNPVPLASGIGVRFKFRLPLDKDGFVTVLARSHHCIDHPEHAGDKLVYFYYYGIDKFTQKRLKKFTSRTRDFTGLKDEDASTFAYNTENLFLTEEEKIPKNVVILDIDTQTTKQISSILTENIGQLNVVTESSYYIFLKEYLKDEDLKNKDGSQDTSLINEYIHLGDIYGEEIKWVVSGENSDLVEVIDKPKEDSHILGYLGTDIFESPKEWKSLFQTKDSQSLLDETLIVFGMSDKTINRMFPLTTAEGVIKWAKIEFSKSSIGRGNIQLSLKVPDDEWIKKKQAGPLKSLDLLIVNDSLISDSVNEWFDRVQQLAANQGLIAKGKSLKVLVYGDSDKWIDIFHRKYRHSKIQALHFQPFDSRSLLFQVSILSESRFTKYNFDNQVYISQKIPVHITKEVTLDGISEFGASLTYPAEIEPGTVLYLHEEIFDSAPNSCLPAKFYHCEESETEEGSFSCSFIYYGISDSFLKLCRAWIRESYALKKSKEG